MNEDYQKPTPVTIKPSSIHGLGVFASTDIKEGEVIEISPILELKLPINLIVDEVLKDYVFLNLKETVGDFGNKTYLGLGYLSLYNHQDDPNAQIRLNYERKIGTIVAKSDIKAGQEIFISYGNNYFKYRKLYQNLSEEVKKKLHSLDEKLGAIQVEKA